MAKLSERERFYDSEIAPALKDLCARCRERGLSFLAVVEWEPGESGSTAQLQKSHGLGIELANIAAAANGNADSLITYMMQHARERGHSSVCLRVLGVPLSPASRSIAEGRWG